MTTNTRVSRSRWAAVGAAVAVTLGAGGLAVTNAAGDSDPSAFRSIIPCRLADTRPGADNVGDKSSPLGPEETHTLAATGPSGDCDVPAGATAVVANVTAVNATQRTNLRLFPAGTALPNASSLNPAPGQPPTPNAVTFGLDTNGEFSIFNEFGSVDVVIDLVGYFQVDAYDDRYAGREVTRGISLVNAISIGTDKPLDTNGCLFDGAAPWTLALPIDLPVGAAVTALSVDVRSIAGSADEFSIFLRKRAPTSTAGMTEVVLAGALGVDALGLATPQRLTYEPPIVDDPVVGAKEEVYLTFDQGGGGDHAVCNAQISYTLPEAGG
ncbi:MAG: hypothetical protein AAGG08_02405 [Actinomycetota bacterium]